MGGNRREQRGKPLSVVSMGRTVQLWGQLLQWHRD